MAPTSPPSPAQPAADVVSAVGLSRSFGDVRAVAGLDLRISEGEVVALVGPDGAGKSTLIRMLATVLRADSGRLEVFGHPVATQPDRVTPLIGYMSQRFSMYPDLTVAENLDFFAKIRGVAKAVRRERSAALLAGMGLAEFTARQAQFLSGGMKQKLMLATTLMHDPELLLLDEPTTGVDPVSRREFWRIVADVHRAGKTVLVATPYMDEAERCSHVAFMDSGRIRNYGTPAQIKALVPGTLYEIASPDPRAALAASSQLDGVTSSHLFGDVVRVLWREGDQGEPQLRAGLQAVPGSQVRVAPVDLESAFAFLAAGGGS